MKENKKILYIPFPFFLRNIALIAIICVHHAKDNPMSWRFWFTIFCLLICYSGRIKIGCQCNADIAARGDVCLGWISRTCLRLVQGCKQGTTLQPIIDEMNGHPFLINFMTWNTYQQLNGIITHQLKENSMYNSHSQSVFSLAVKNSLRKQHVTGQKTQWRHKCEP